MPRLQAQKLLLSLSKDCPPGSRQSVRECIPPAAPCAPADRRRRPRHKHSVAPTDRWLASADSRPPCRSSAARSPKAKDWAHPCRARPSGRPESRQWKRRADKEPAEECRGSSSAEPISAESTTNSGCARLPSSPHDRAPSASTPRPAPIPVWIGRAGSCPCRTTRRRPSGSSRSACLARNAANSASTACWTSRFAPHRRISVRGCRFRRSRPSVTG